MELQHFSHRQHPLLLIDDDQYYTESLGASLDCEICYDAIAPPFYGCDLCRYYIHKKCADLPQKISHPFHPSHPLSLLTDQRRWRSCDSCHKQFLFTPWFGCHDCGFFMDKKCALMPRITHIDQKQVTIQHFTHQHAMPHFMMDGRDGTLCSSCGLASSGSQAYACYECGYFLHKSCAELPREIQHYDFHKHHRVFLFFSHEEFSCRLCAKENRRGFAYKCCLCGFCLCVVCATSTNLSRGFEYKGHEHVLYFVEMFHAKLVRCSSYETYCKQEVLLTSVELDRTSSSVLRCLECDFTLHLLCGPLPSMITHDCHIDPLILADSVIEDDDSDEYYCDVCETERDPRICVYHCKDCKFVAHIHCVVSEVIKVLKGDIRDVELKIVGEDTAEDEEPNEVVQLSMTLKDLINKLDPYEKEKLAKHYIWNESTSSASSLQDHSNELGDKEIDRIIKFYSFSDEDMGAFVGKELDDLYDAKLELKPSDLSLKITKLEGYNYMIPRTLVPVLRKLLHKYGDVLSDDDKGSPSSTTQEWKSVMYFLLCQVVKQMYGTRVVDVNQNLLREWILQLNFLEETGGFRVGFADEHLLSLVQAVWGTQASRIKEEIPRKLEREIAELEREITKKKAELAICREFHKASPRSQFAKGCLKKALELKWKNASEGLL